MNDDQDLSTEQLLFVFNELAEITDEGVCATLVDPLLEYVRTGTNHKVITTSFVVLMCYVTTIFKDDLRKSVFEKAVSALKPHLEMAVFVNEADVVLSLLSNLSYTKRDLTHEELEVLRGIKGLTRL